MKNRLFALQTKGDHHDRKIPSQDTWRRCAGSDKNNNHGHEGVWTENSPTNNQHKTA